MYELNNNQGRREWRRFWHHRQRTTWSKSSKAEGIWVPVANVAAGLVVGDIAFLIAITASKPPGTEYYLSHEPALHAIFGEHAGTLEPVLWGNGAEWGCAKQGTWVKSAHGLARVVRYVDDQYLVVPVQPTKELLLQLGYPRLDPDAGRRNT